DAVGNGDVFGLAAAEAEDGPAGAERGIGHGDELVAAEQGACVVLTGDVAIDDVDVLGAVDVEAVIVEVDAIVDADAVQLHVTAFQDAHAVVGAAREEDVADREIAAAVEDAEVGPLGVAFGAVAARAGIVAAAGEELVAVTVDGPAAFDGDVVCVDG